MKRIKTIKLSEGINRVIIDDDSYVTFGITDGKLKTIILHADGVSYYINNDLNALANALNKRKVGILEPKSDDTP